MLIYKLPSLGFTANIPQRLIEAFCAVMHYYFRLSADSRWNNCVTSWSVHFQKVTFAIIKASDILLMKSFSDTMNMIVHKPTDNNLILLPGE